MKLLLDENLSYRLLDAVGSAFPGSGHVTQLGLETEDDRGLWEYAKEHGFVLVTKDSDFQELATVHGAPPKIIWLKCGNRPRQYVASLLLKHREAIIAFAGDPDATVAEIW